MNLNKIHISLHPILIVTVILSCRPQEKTTPQNKKTSDTISTNDIAIIKNDTLGTDTKTHVIDVDVVLDSFNKATKTERFNDQNKLDGGSIFDLERPILIGDLNGDHLNDALMPFSIEGGGQGGNNWESYYAIFINNGGILEYEYSFSRGDNFSQTLINFESIKDRIIKGVEVPGIHSEQGERIPVDYIYQYDQLSEVATAVIK